MCESDLNADLELCDCAVLAPTESESAPCLFGGVPVEPGQEQRTSVSLFLSS